MVVSIRAESSTLIRVSYEIRTAAALAMDSVRAHKLRSFLTLLGVIIGVASVVLVGAAIEGLGVYAEQSTAKVFGGNTYLIARVSRAVGRTEYFAKLRRNKSIRPEDVRYLQSSTGDRILYSPFDQRSGNVVHREAMYEDAMIQGVAAVMPELRDINMQDGRFFTDQEDRTGQAVCVIGHDVAGKIFPSSSAVGRTVRISGVEFRVIGVQEQVGSSFGRSMDNSVYIPFRVYSRLFSGRRSVAVFASSRPGSGLSLDEALDLTRVALRTRQKTRPGKPDQFDATTPDAIRSFIDGMLSMISAVVVPVTCISLVVGGIVIMNIMLVSVTERTHEIGIRKSLGARPADIRLQFLIEAVILAAAGGVAGILLGMGLTEVLERVFQIALRVSLTYVLLALAVSSAVGILSGWYPAMRASRLDPVQALRAE